MKIIPFGNKYFGHHNTRGKNNPFYGKRHSKETKKRLSEIHTGFVQPESVRLAISIANKGRKPTDRERLAISIGRTGIKFTEEHKRNLSKSWDREKHFTERVRRRLSEAAIKLWKDPKFVSKMKEAHNISPNKKETFLLSLLNDLYPGEWKFTGDFSFTINGKSPDFTNCNGQKKVIELFGDYWHRGQDPQARKDIFKEFGYQTLVIWEHELEDVEMIKFRIHRFVKQGAR